MHLVRSFGAAVENVLDSRLDAIVDLVHRAAPDDPAVKNHGDSNRDSTRTRDVMGNGKRCRTKSCPDAPRRLEPCIRFIRLQPNGFHSNISFGSTVSAAKRAINIAAAINTPK